MKFMEECSFTINVTQLTLGKNLERKTILTINTREKDNILDLDQVKELVYI